MASIQAGEFIRLAEARGIASATAQFIWEASRPALRLVPSGQRRWSVRVGGPAGSLGGQKWPVRTKSDDDDRLGSPLRFVAEIRLADLLRTEHAHESREGALKLFVDADERFGDAVLGPGAARVLLVPVDRDGFDSEQHALELPWLATPRWFTVTEARSLPDDVSVLQSLAERALPEPSEQTLGLLEVDFERAQGYSDLTGFRAAHDGDATVPRHQLFGNWFPTEEDAGGQFDYFLGETSMPLLQLVADPTLGDWLSEGTRLTFAVSNRMNEPGWPSAIDAMTLTGFQLAD